jgi:hypothetical protein
MKNFLALMIILVLYSNDSYSQKKSTWRVVGNLSVSRTRHESVYIGYSRILVFGGTTNQGVTNTVEIVNFESNTVLNSASMKTPRAEFASLVTQDSLVLAIGGTTGQDDVISSIEAYNIKSGIWTDYGNLLFPRRQFTAIWLSTTEFLVVGGREFATQTINTAEIFNITTKTSRQIPNYPVLCNNPASGYSSQGIPIIFGGREGGTGSNQTTIVYNFDIQQNKWIPVGNMINASEFPPAIKLWNGQLSYTGGDNEIQRKNDWLKDVAIEENNSFRLLGTMKKGRHTHFLAQWNETTLLTGGGMTIGGQSLNTTEWIDITNGVVTDGPTMNHPHAQGSFLTIPIYENGKPIASKIVVISGFGEDFQLSPSVEILEQIITPCDYGVSSRQLPNLYAPIAAISIDRRTLTTPKPIALCPNNKLLIIQMRGAEVTSTPTDSYGKVTSLSDAGNYEFTRIQSIAGNTITLEKPLTRSYNPAGKVQIVRVPEFQNFTLTDKLVCPKWNDTIFGVIALAVSDTLRLQQPIVADGAGFAGGRVVNADTTAQEHIDSYFGIEDPKRYALKGDGIANYLSDEHRSARGAVANAGGGGNNHNAGGGGGSNGGCGGKGGFGWDLMAKGSKELAQGLGGYAIDNSVSNKLFMGGGGGAGHSNEKTGTSGGNGGGIIIIDAKTIVSVGSYISANGESVKSAPYDGAGGGGGGGTIILTTNTIIGQLSLEANGGSGGGVTVHRDGPGGGGGGGVIGFSLAIPPNGIVTDFRGGYGGKSRTLEDYGQTDGCKGTLLTNVIIPGDKTILEGIHTELPTKEDQTTVYPLPAEEIVTISFGEQFPATSCLIYDVLGKFIANGIQTDGEQWNIDVSSFNAGVYFAAFRSSTGTKIIRIIVRH